MSYRRAVDKYRIGVRIYNHEDCEIYEAVEVATGNSVIIKTLNTASEDQTNSILDESTIQMRLQHDHICQVFGVYLNGPTVNIVLQKMRSDLEAVVKMKQRAGQFFEEAEIVEMLRQVCSALCYAKEKNIAHRDIKPANIFVAGDNYYKVGDFGSALQVVSSRDAKYTMVGTPLYLSPQLVAGYISVLATGDSQVEYDPYKADVYALGITVLYMARGGNINELLPLHGKVDVIGAVWALSCSDWLKQLLTGMLQEQEGQRLDIEYVLGFIQPSQPQYTQLYANAATVEIGASMSQTVPQYVSQQRDMFQTVPQQASQQREMPQTDTYAQSTSQPMPQNTVDTPQVIGECVFCQLALKSNTRKYQFQMKCQHMACTKRCYDNYTSLNVTCPACEARKANYQSSFS